MHAQLKKDLMKQHGQRYAALLPKRQDEYNTQAQKMKGQAAIDRSKDLLHLKQALALHRSRAAELDAALDLPCLVSNCRFNPEQLLHLQKAWDNIAFGKKALCVQESLQCITSPQNIPLEFV